MYKKNVVGLIGVRTCVQISVSPTLIVVLVNFVSGGPANVCCDRFNYCTDYECAKNE